MTELLELLSQPFMQRAIFAGILVAILCSIIGVFIVLRKESFIADALAHGSLSGIAFALLISSGPFFFALIVGVVMASLITFLKRRLTVSADAIIGIIYTFLFALGIILLSLSPTYRPELSTYLFGSILSINIYDGLYAFLTLAFVIIAFQFIYEKILYITFDPESAFLRGIKVARYDYLLTILTSIVVIVSVKIVGVVLVSALLIMPGVGAKLLARKFSHMIPIAIIFSLIATIIGIIVSGSLNIPMGASIVVVSTILLLLFYYINKLVIRKMR